MENPLSHQDLNHDLAVFASHALVGAGLPLWLPAGAAIRTELQRLAKEIAHADGCEDVYTPALGKRELYERSGHWAKFAADMFPPLELGGEQLVLRPANCPHHALVYAARQHSYRDLPVRLNELAPMFRAERSGVVGGLGRVRQISLDDTHVFCRPDQVQQEAARALRSALHAQRVLGLDVDYVRLSLRDDSDAWLGSANQWEASQAALAAAAAEVLPGAGLALRRASGEAAFYGPKLDLQVRDAAGRESTIATIQLDFNQPERFDLGYQAADGSRQRVVMIHRGTVGAMERVVAALLERYQGRLPFWLAPLQVLVLPVSEEQDAAARSIVEQLRAAGLRAEGSFVGTLGGRIRAGRQRRASLQVVVGQREVDAGTVQVSGQRRQEIPVSELVAGAAAAYQHRQPLRW
ncbi:threonine--tRNA ligase [Buchananella hordeovulneris]|uniref:threonine--tRNA ligase n=1 Tax=Buchananella hordeovulneris TaxID=52770 RepID=UPI000F5FA406|nr:threonine--tRNA ligase [Buchananella hordeovulneris]RRD42082.1 threonine--tRNA ligase [Buchananella hordeovulneris]RRD50376.1 threonine--tRNA ligase [Buchananella hordeovulneris]